LRDAIAVGIDAVALGVDPIAIRAIAAGVDLATDAAT